jgi:hypothetical protein
MEDARTREENGGEIRKLGLEMSVCVLVCLYTPPQSNACASLKLIVRPPCEPLDL